MSDIQDWTKVPTLVEADFGEKIKHLRDLVREREEIEEREAVIRDEIEALVTPLGHSVRTHDYVARWTPPSTTEKLDRSRLVAAGVTPDQLAAATVRSPKKGFLTIGRVKDVG